MLQKIIAIFLLSFAQAIAAQTIAGRVVGVSDGDTITVLDALKRQTRVRLAQIDAPEKSQDFGQVSKRSLSDLVYGKSVTVEIETIDKYGRVVGRVLVGGQDANLAQVKAGMAWVYRQYAHDSAYFSAEESARAAKLGLWSRSDAVPPWEFRRGGKGSAGRSEGTPRALILPAQRSAATMSAAGSCGEKSTCGQMASCEEARHYLRDCGLSKLDGDGDGTPCESLCK